MQTSVSIHTMIVLTLSLLKIQKWFHEPHNDISVNGYTGPIEIPKLYRDLYP